MSDTFSGTSPAPANGTTAIGTASVRPSVIWISSSARALTASSESIATMKGKAKTRIILHPWV